MVSKFHEANQLARMGDLEGAVVAYRLAIAENAGIDQAYHNLGETLCKLERWDEAIAAFQQGLAINPRARLSHFCLGEVFAKRQQWLEALECYREAIELQLHEPEVWCALGVARMSLGCEGEAFEAYQKAIEIILHQGGASPINQSQIREAIRNWQALLDKYPVEVPARVYLHLSGTCRRMMDYGVADTIFQQGKERYSDLDLAGESVEAALSQPDGSEMLSYWKEFLDLYPRKAPARVYLFMSLAHAHIRDYVAAENMLLNGKQAYANFLDWATEYAGVIKSQGDWQESLQPWQYLLDIYLDKASATVYVRMSRVYCGLGRYSRGEQMILNGIEKYPHVAELAYEYIQVAMFRQNWSEAIRRCQDVLDRYQEKAPAKIYLWMGRSYANRGDYEVAESVISQGREKYPNSIELACEYPQISVLQQDWSGVIQRCQDLLDIYPEQVPAKVYLWMSQAWANNGEYEKAENFIFKGKERYPNSEQLACEYAQIAMSQNNWSEAVQRWQAVLDTYQDKAAAKVYVLMSMACAHLEDYVAAETLLLRGRGEYPNLFDLAGEYAEVFKAEGDRSESLVRWRDLLDIYRETALVKSYLLLSRKYCKNGNYAEAENIILKGRSRYPDSWELASEYAQIAMYQQDWSEAIAGWSHVLDTYPEQAPSSVYVRLNRAYCSVKDYVAAESILLKGRETYPNAMDIAYEYCYLPMRQKDFYEAIQRSQDLLDTCPGKVPAKIYSLMSVACRSMGDYSAAENIVIRAMEKYSNSVDLAYEYAEIAIAQRDWQEAIKRSQDILNLYQEKAPAKAYARLSLAYRFTEDIDSAEEIIQKGLEQHLDSRQLLREYAELAMVRRDWELALQRWQAFVGEISHEQIEEQTFPSLPPLSKTDDWLDCHWQDFAHYCAEKITHDSFQIPSVSLLFVLVDILVKADFWEEADLIGQKAVNLYPEHLGLSLSYAELSMKRQQWQEAIKRWSGIIQSFGNQTPSQVFLKLSVAQYMLEADGIADADLEDYVSENPYHDKFMAELKENHRIFDKYKANSRSQRELPIYLIHYDPESLLGYQLKYNNFLTPEKIRSLVFKYHRKKTGNKKNSIVFNHTVNVAYRLSRKFGLLFQRKPEMPKDMLSEAVFYQILLEVWTALPLKKLSKVMVKNSQKEPIFIELNSDQIFYCTRFSSVSISTLTPFYLYFFLKKANANVFLCLRKERSNRNLKPHHVSINFLPSPPLLDVFRKPIQEIKNSTMTTQEHNSAIVIDGMRSIDKDIIKVAEMYSVSCRLIYLNQEYQAAQIYSKIRKKDKIHHRFNIDLYADRVFPKKVSIEFENPDLIISKSAHFSHSESTINKAKIDKISLLKWLEYTLGEMMFNMAKQAHRNVKKYKITQLHICDFFGKEARIMAYAVKIAGGKITLWPHSSNPVFPELQNDQLIDQIYCTTKKGANIWHNFHPEIPVSLVADSMLPSPTRKLKNKLNEKQTIVILGSPNFQMLTPFLDLECYDSSLNTFLESLFQIKDINVIYKPKGYAASVFWFSKVANKYSRDWKITDHTPLEINYPNMIFVTIGMGSTALLEGISRGIPAMIVRGFEVNCYTTIDTNIITTGTAEMIVEEIIKCKDCQYREQLISRQMEYYCREIGLIDRSSLIAHEQAYDQRNKV